ncbi:hypothetical protein EVAR_29837_1 [Eumeta japonica]|uniref:Uncharacterized protein n=1 Tax=Eumeta variegata TaxID=151549 RepID=A0A4C1VUN9_EUMVA|nr:hypothetical protein EVAR_29837_1 [Eumeta japonica]
MRVQRIQIDSRESTAVHDVVPSNSDNNSDSNRPCPWWLESLLTVTILLARWRITWPILKTCYTSIKYPRLFTPTSDTDSLTRYLNHDEKGMICSR